MCSGSKLMLRHLPASLRSAPLVLPGSRPAPDAPALPAAKSSPFPDSLNLVETEHSFIREALRRSGENRSAAARLLGISRRTLHRKLHELGLAAGGGAE
jgi:two-component system, NtrC family, response regulator AtoC